MYLDKREMSARTESRGLGTPDSVEGTPGEDGVRTSCVLVECAFKSWLDNIEPEKLQVWAEMYDNQSCTDVVIQCCDHQLIHAHRDVLTARSQLFNLALKKSSRKCAVLEIKYLPFKYVKALVDLMYHDKVTVEEEDAGRLVYLMHQFQLRGAFGKNGAEGLLLRLGGAKLLGEHFDRLFEYTYADTVPKFQGRQPRETQRQACLSEPRRKSRPRASRRTSEPVKTHTIKRERATSQKALPHQVKLEEVEVKAESVSLPELKTVSTVEDPLKEERVKEPAQKAVRKRKPRVSKKSCLLIPTKAAHDSFVGTAAPDEYPKAASKLDEVSGIQRQVAVTATPKAKTRRNAAAAANTKMCLDALSWDQTHQFTNVDMDGKKIPRPPNAFMIFGQDFRKLLAEENPVDSNKAVSVALGRAWGTLDDWERQAYYELQEAYKQQHQMRYPGYAYCPAHARHQKALRQRSRNNLIA